MYSLLRAGTKKKPQSSDEENTNFIHPTQAAPFFNSSAPYDPNLFPPNIQLCEIHSQSHRVSFPKRLYDKMQGKSIDYNEAIDVCDCCGYPVENVLIPLSTPPKDLLFLGSAFPLLFNFMKYGIALCFIILALSGIYNLTTNTQSTDCNSDLEILGKKCEPDYFTETSLLNKAFHTGFLRSQEILNLISVLLTMVFLQLHRFKQRKLAFKCDLGIVTASDYTLQIDDLPVDLKEKDLKNYLESLPLNSKETIRVFFHSH